MDLRLFASQNGLNQQEKTMNCIELLSLKAEILCYGINVSEEIKDVMQNINHILGTMILFMLRTLLSMGK